MLLETASRYEGRVAANVLVNSRGQPTRCNPRSWVRRGANSSPRKVKLLAVSQRASGRDVHGEKRIMHIGRMVSRKVEGVGG
jgi:hypothetical protein